VTKKDDNRKLKILDLAIERMDRRIGRLQAARGALVRLARSSAAESAGLGIPEVPPKAGRPAASIETDGQFGHD